MKSAIRRAAFAILASTFAASAANAQWYSHTLHGGSFSAGYSGQFTTPLTTNPSNANESIRSTGGGSLNESVSGQQQFTPDTGGLLISVQMHPVAWAGVEVNYGYFRSSEIYQFNYASIAAPQVFRTSETVNEATAAYEFHPPHIPLQPFLNIGGGALSFIPHLASNQWRGTGLVEVGLDIPTHVQHLALRVEGRSLIYRSPNFNMPALSTRGWRVTDEPVASLVYRF